MRIIIEGADLTGKSTVVKKLVERNNLSMIHTTYRDNITFEYLMVTLDKHDMIFDRHLLSEYIYPAIFNREPKLTKEQLDIVMNRALELGYKIIVTTVSDAELKRRLLTREEPPEVQEQLLEINQRFIELAEKYNIPVINTLTTDTMKLVRELEK